MKGGGSIASSASTQGLYQSYLLISESTFIGSSSWYEGGVFKFNDFNQEVSITKSKF